MSYSYEAENSSLRREHIKDGYVPLQSIQCHLLALSA
jgi:hypothetical protein